MMSMSMAEKLKDWYTEIIDLERGKFMHLTNKELAKMDTEYGTLLNSYMCESNNDLQKCVQVTWSSQFSTPSTLSSLIALVTAKLVLVKTAYKRDHNKGMAFSKSLRPLDIIFK